MFTLLIILYSGSTSISSYLRTIYTPTNHGLLLIASVSKNSITQPKFNYVYTLLGQHHNNMQHSDTIYYSTTRHCTHCGRPSANVVCACMKKNLYEIFYIGESQSEVQRREINPHSINFWIFAAISGFCR